MNYQSEKDVAAAAVTDACGIAEAVRATFVRADTIIKADASPVTVADFAVQCQISIALRAAYSEVTLLAEEEGADLRGEERAHVRKAVLDHVRRVVPNVAEADMLAALDYGRHAAGVPDRFWTLDPVDGTKGFLRGGQYAIALALIVGSEVVVAVLGCPSYPHDASHQEGPRGCLFIAVKGQGAWMRLLGTSVERPIHVSSIDIASEAVLCESVESAHSSHGHSQQVSDRLGASAPPLRMDSQCKYAAVARGDAAIYLRLPTRADYAERIWDHAAGCLIVQEAGGQVTDVHGLPLDFTRGRTLSANSGVVATNGILHRPVLSAVEHVLNAG